MRYKTFLTEEVFGVNFYDKIIADCYKFLTATQGRAYYRGGMPPAHNAKYEIYDTRWTRKPTDTPNGVHDLCNKFFQKKFGWSGRSGVFATPNRGQALGYNKSSSEGAYVFMAVDMKKYLWSPHVGDLFSTLDGKYDLYTLRTIEKTVPNALSDRKVLKANPSYVELKEALLKNILPTYLDTNLEMNKGHEVMFNCDKYYVFEERLGKKILTYYNRMRNL